MRSRPSRLFTLLTTVWVWIFLTQPAIPAMCPMHVAAAGAHAGMMDGGSHMPHSHDPGAGVNECSCVHPCANGGAVVPQSAEVEAPVVAETAIDFPALTSPTWHPAPREHARPPSQAPPAFTA